MKGLFFSPLFQHLLHNSKITVTFAPAMNNGSLAEWLGAGLQNRPRRFESARNLNLCLSRLITVNRDLSVFRNSNDCKFEGQCKFP